MLLCNIIPLSSWKNMFIGIIFAWNRLCPHDNCDRIFRTGEQDHWNPGTWCCIAEPMFLSFSLAILFFFESNPLSLYDFDRLFYNTLSLSASHTLSLSLSFLPLYLSLSITIFLSLSVFLSIHSLYFKYVQPLCLVTSALVESYFLFELR